MRVSLSPEEFKELLLSHHPDLPCFNDDVILLFNRRICAGCLLAYPAAALVLWVVRPTGIGSIFLALLFAALSQVRRLSHNAPINHFFRFIAGVALGFGIGGGYWAIMHGNWAVVVLLVSGAGVYLLVKANALRQKSENCTKD